MSDTGTVFYNETPFVYPLLKGIILKLKSLQVEEQPSSTLYKGLKKMLPTLQTFVEVIDDAELLEIHSEQVRDWLQCLQEVVEEVDDLTDEVQMNNINHLPNKVSSSLMSRIMNPSSSYSLPNSKLSQPLKRIGRTLDGLATDSDLFIKPMVSSGFQGRTTSGARNRSFILYGEDDVRREIDEKAVIDLILKSSAAAAAAAERERGQKKRPVSVIPIVGFYGVGKTTLSDLIFNNESIKEKFDPICWLCLVQACSGCRFVSRNRRELCPLVYSRYYSLTEDDEFDFIAMKMNLGLSQETTKRPFFVVLEAFEDSDLHTRIARELMEIGSYSSGSVILLTTSSLRAAALIGNSPPYRLEPRTSDTFMIPPQLKLLLPSFHLQKACGVTVEALVCVWMALGLLYSDDPTHGQPPEYIGRKYLTDLIQYGLCSGVEYAPGGVVRHAIFSDDWLDLVTPLARQYSWFIPHCESSRILASPARYIIWDEDSLTGHLFSDLKKARLFILCFKGRASPEFAEEIVSESRSLRVLSLGGCDIGLIPRSIGKLKHLRYLDLSRNARIEWLPESIWHLWHLQTLFLHGCSRLKEIPADIWRLKNLRYLTLTVLQDILPETMGELTSLQTLALASCPLLASLPRALSTLKNLRTLGIVNCQALDLAAVSSVAEGFSWLDVIHTLLLSHLPEFESLPFLKPGVPLKHLHIQSCPRVTETTWINCFGSLRSLTIEDCPQLSPSVFIANGLLELVIRRCPSLGYTAWIAQLESLRSVVIDGCPKLVELDAGFSELKNLERLEIRRCPGLTKWFAGKALSCIVHVPVIELDGVPFET